MQERLEIIGVRFGNIRQVERPVERVQPLHVARGTSDPGLGSVPLRTGRQVLCAGT